jgi:tRNA (cmo5U34)-methyltransferase
MSESDNTTPHLAATFDEQVRLTIPFYDMFHEQTISIVKAAHLSPKTWLDTGCGTGTLVQKAIQFFPETKFVLVDPAPKMLNAAKEKLAAGRSHVEFLEASPTHKLTLPSGQFNVVTAIQSHHYSSVAERTEATHVCFQLLAQNGMFITFENIQPFTPKGTAAGKEYWKTFQLSNGRDLKTVEAHMERFGVEYFPITVEEHLSLYRKAGFSSVELLWFSYMQAGFYCIK